ncbi:MAG TPA: TlyA family RNA methyltransferase [Bryobacteraceae bacterium]|nr:TlyA family RNA methyltransferase [Bryobacteraceae bacterium]
MSAGTMKRAAKIRLDQLLVDRGLAESREKARALILAGEVRVDGQKSDKPGHAIAEDASIELLERMPYVSRGGLKLAGALDRFSIDVTGRVCLDVGASTGGFTDCLLQRGAARVCAIDVGHGQIDWRLRNHPQVEIREGVNARYLQAGDFPEKFDLAVCDASFISVTLLIPAIVPLLGARGEMIILIKPQFEVGREQVGKGGIVRDPDLHRLACDRVRAAVERFGFRADIIESPIRGAEGNREFLLYARH